MLLTFPRTDTHILKLDMYMYMYMYSPKTGYTHSQTSDIYTCTFSNICTTHPQNHVIYMYPHANLQHVYTCMWKQPYFSARPVVPLLSLPA